MLRLRYQLIDLLILFTCVSLLLGFYLAGFRPVVPRFLTGDLDSYFTTSVQVDKEKSWHSSPSGPLLDRLLGNSPGNLYSSQSGEQFAIGQFKTVQRFNWFLFVRDVLLCIAFLLLVVVLFCASRAIVSVKSPQRSELK